MANLLGTWLASLSKLFLWTTRQVIGYALRLQKFFARLLLIYSTFIVCNYSPLQYVLFLVDMIFREDIYNY